MTAVVFEHWLDKWNERLARQQSHILLLIENAPSHITKEYSNIRVEFLQPNTTPKLQPLDQGIICICKVQYHTIPKNKLVQMLDNEKDVKKVMADFDFITDCGNIVPACDSVTPQLTEKCFNRAGFICSVPTAPEPEPERNVWDNIQQILNVQNPFSEYATADN